MLVTTRVIFFTPINPFLGYLKYSPEDILKIFHSMNFSDQVNTDLKGKLSEELVRNVFREEKRTELCVNEADIISISKSDR